VDCFQLLTWQDGGNHVPDYWVADTAAPGQIKWGCASTDDTHVYPGLHLEESRFPVVQVAFGQQSGTAVIDLTNASCAKAWGLDINLPIRPLYNSGSFVQISAGAAIVNLDAWNDYRRSTGQTGVIDGDFPFAAQTSSGKLVSLDIATAAYALTPTPPSVKYSCFSGPMAPAGASYADMPTDPAPYSGTVKVGDTLHVSVADLVQQTGWVDTFIVGGSANNELAANGTFLENLDGSFDWTPTKAGTFTFQHTPAAPHCISHAIDGTITATPAAAVTLPTTTTPTPTPLQPVVATALAPAQHMTTPPQLAETGSNVNIAGWGASGLAILGVGMAALLFVRRRNARASRGEG
jgi:hypothetical protein